MADIFDFYVYDDRSIQYAIAEPIMLEDKDVTQFRFRIPKVLNNIDMTDWEWWFIFVNAKKIKYTTQLTLTDDEDAPDNYSNATYTVGYGFSGYVGSVSFSIEALNVSGEDIVNEWHTRTYHTTVTDTLQGTRAVIPEPEGQSGTGLTEEIRQALLQLARKVAYIDEHGQTYYDALYNALYPPAELVSISAVYTQSGTVHDTDSLDSLKADLVVTANYAGGTSDTVPSTDYTLSGTLAVGTSTITVSYGGKTTTFNVTVTDASASRYPLENGTHAFTVTNRSLTVSDGKHFSYTNNSPATSGTGGYINLSQVSENDAKGTSSASYNRETVWFTIPAGASYVFSLTNITFNNMNTTNYSMAFRMGTVETTIKIPDRHVDTDAAISGTATEDMAITSLGMYVRNSYSLLEGDISFIVNGERWI